MNFELTDEQKDIQKAAREFAQGEFDPDLALELDQTGAFPESLWKKASQLGFIGIHYPEEFGGQGLGLFEAVLVMEAFCRIDSGIGCALGMVDWGSEAILRFGSKEQREQFLIPLAQGTKRMSIAFAESEDDRDLSSLSTVSERKGEQYYVWGEKRFVPSACHADFFLTLCKDPQEGWLTLVVERENKGLEVIPMEKMGLRMIPSGDLLLKGIGVPLKNRIGNPGEGMVHVNYSHQVIGIRSASQAVGISQGALDRAMEHSKQREQFGRRLSQFQAIRHKLAEMAVNVEVSRWLVYQCATEYDQGKLDLTFLQLTRLIVMRNLLKVVDEALQIFGGYGYMAEQAIEHYFRDAWEVSVSLGNEEELRDTIAEQILG